MAIEQRGGYQAVQESAARPSDRFRGEIRLLALAALLIWLALGLVVVMMGKKEWDGITSTVQSNATTVARLLAVQSDQLLLTADVTRDHAARVLGDAGPFIADRAAQQALAQMITRSQTIVSIWVGDARGDAVLTTREYPTPDLNAASRDYFTTVRDDPARLFVGNLIDSQYPAEALLINTSRRLSHPDGTMRGFIQISLDPATISRTFQHVEIGFDAALWWISPNGRALIRDPALPPQELDARMPPGASDWPRNWPGDGGPGPAEALTGQSGIDGTERLFFWSDAPLYGSRIIVGVSRAAMVDRWMVQMIWATALAFAVGLAGMAILWLLYRSRQRGALYAAQLENDVRDRTEALALAVAQKDVVMQELSHRVRNAFATILALTRLMLRSSDTLDRLRRDFPPRLEALARSHLVLVDARVRDNAQINDLVQAALAPYENEDTRVVLTGPAVELSANATLGVGLILHELVTNAVKYGSLSVPGGTISVQWQAQPEAIQLIWQESGGPAVTPPSERGSGSMIIDRAASLFGGIFMRDFATDGVRAELTIPVA